MALLWNVLSFFALVLVLLYGFYRRRFNYWKSRGVEGPEPTLVFGNLIEIPKKKLSIGVFFERIYKENQHLPFVGIYMMHRPVLLLVDLDLIRSVLIRDFEYFTDRPIQFDKTKQPITDNLFTAGGARWKGIRNKLTPAFTSNKIKYMFDIMLKCGQDLQKYLEGESGVVDVKEMCAKYATDAIASCAFGLESNCFVYPDAEFRVIGRKVSSFSLARTVTIFTMLCAPDLQKIFNGQFMEKDISDFFIRTVTKTVEHREKNNIVRNDLLQLMIRLKNKESIDDHESLKNTDHGAPDITLSISEIAAQCFSFFFAGFEASSTTLATMLHELSLSPSIQQRAFEEITSILKKHDGKITYDSLNEMTYITQILEENLRIHSTAPQNFRTCVKDYKIPNTDIVIEKGTPLYISTQGIHKNPKYYPNPDQFNPDNFSPEAKAKRDQMAYIPFGEGPRLCIGYRFSQIQIKIAIVTILKNFEVKPPANSTNRIENNAISLIPEVSLFFVKRRTDYLNIVFT